MKSSREGGRIHPFCSGKPSGKGGKPTLLYSVSGVEVVVDPTVLQSALASIEVGKLLLLLGLALVGMRLAH